MAEFKSEQIQRFRYMELLLLWEGEIQRKKVAKTFGIAMNYVTKVIGEYQKLFSENIDYDHRKRRYLRGKNFKPQFCIGSTDEYLTMLKGQLFGIWNDSLSVDVLSYCTTTPTPIQAVSPSILRTLTTGLINNKQIKIKYQSLKDESPSSRVISPHSLVCVGHRWHVRAFDSSRDGYRDFVLHRIISIAVIEAKGIPSGSDDDWNNEVELIITPNPLASEGQKKIIAKEYGMKPVDDEWHWRISMKRCLVPYLVQKMRLDEDAVSVSKHPVALKNIKEVELLFFKGS